MYPLKLNVWENQLAFNVTIILKADFRKSFSIPILSSMILKSNEKSEHLAKREFSKRKLAGAMAGALKC